MRKKHVQEVKQNQGHKKGHQPTNQPTVPHPKNVVLPSPIEQSTSPQYSWLDIRKRWREWCIAVILAILSNFIYSLVGEPSASVVRQQPLLWLLIPSCIVFFLVVSIRFSNKPKSSLSSNYPYLNRIGHGMLTKGLPISSILLFFLLFMTVNIRPPGCPTWICPAAKYIYHINGYHDDGNNLEVYPNDPSIESTWYVIPGNIAQYTLANLPTDIGAVRLDEKSSSSLYQAIIGIHNLQQEGTGIIIEQVTLVNVHVTSVPNPLNVWGNTMPIFYNVRPYEAIYTDNYRESKVPIPAVGLLKGIVLHLDPGESEQLDVQVLSQSPLPTYLKFQIQVTYSTLNGKGHVILPHVFEVAFSKVSNWHPYQFIHGHFIAIL